MCHVPILRLMPWLFLAATASGAVENATGWRGNGSGCFTGATVPKQIDETTALWKAALPGEGSAAPLVVGDLVVVCVHPSTVLGFDATGTEVWRTDIPLEGEIEERANAEHANAYINPAFDGERLIVGFIGAPNVVAALGLDGRILWSNRLNPSKQMVMVGCSMAVLGDVVGVSGGKAPAGKGPGQIIGLRRDTGKPAWMVRDLRHGNHGHTAPLLAFDLGGQRWLATPGGVILDVTGAVAGDLGQAADCGTGPVIVGDVAYVSKGDTYDRGPQGVVAFKLAVEAGKVTATRLWRTDCTQSGCTIVCPLVDQGIVYAFMRNNKQSLSMFDATTGAAISNNAKLAYESPGHVWRARPALGDGHIVLPMPTGKVQILKVAGGASAVTATGSIEQLPSNPTFAGDRVYIRTKGSLYAFAAR
jgi:outer membrane protein assembly factor BamB